MFSFGRKQKSKSEYAEETSIAPVQEGQKKGIEKKKKKWFGKKSEEREQEEPTAEQAASVDVVEFAEQTPEQRYALILHQYEAKRQTDLVWLIQQISQVSEERAKRL